MTKTTHAGFTMVELLVVIAIVGVLVAMLLPAVQAVRETARRAQCSHRLSQLLIATHNYESAHRRFPAGVVNDTGPIISKPIGYHYSWAVQLLPYLEEQNAFRSIDFSVGVYDPANSAVRMHHIGILACPSAPRSANRVAVASYAAVYHDAEVPIDADCNGVFFRNSFLRYDQISDGLAYTLFYGGKRTGPNILDDLGWMSGTRATLRNTGIPLNMTDAPPVVPPSPPNQGNPYGVLEPVQKPVPVVKTPAAKKPAVGGFGGWHPVAVQFAFGDGSVRGIAESCDRRTMQLLGNRADGQMVELDF